MGAAYFVAGCGSIGRRHIRNLRALTVDPIHVFDLNSESMDAAVRDFSVSACTSFEDGAQRASLALICTPPNEHVPLAMSAVRAGCHVFIEKPISDTVTGVQDLLECAAERRRIVYTGYNLRFHRGLRRVHQILKSGVMGRLLSLRAEFGQYLPDWRPNTDYRLSYTAQAALGGGIVRDASHEIDYVRWLSGEVRSVSCVADRVSSLEMDVEDTAEITLRFESGAIGQIHVDCTQRDYTRNCKLICEEGTLLWDYASGLRQYDPRTRTWQYEPFEYDANLMYVDELSHVLACVSGETPPEVDGAAGARVLQITLAALESAATHREVLL
jgi:predicted dehydrogenase